MDLSLIKVLPELTFRKLLAQILLHFAFISRCQQMNTECILTWFACLYLHFPSQSALTWRPLICLEYFLCNKSFLQNKGNKNSLWQKLFSYVKKTLMHRRYFDVLSNDPVKRTYCDTEFQLLGFIEVAKESQVRARGTFFPLFPTVTMVCWERRFYGETGKYFWCSKKHLTVF